MRIQGAQKFPLKGGAEASIVRPWLGERTHPVVVLKKEIPEH